MRGRAGNDRSERWAELLRLAVTGNTKEQECVQKYLHDNNYAINIEKNGAGAEVGYKQKKNSRSLTSGYSKLALSLNFHSTTCTAGNGPGFQKK